MTSRVLETKQNGSNFWDCWILIKKNLPNLAQRKTKKLKHKKFVSVCFISEMNLIFWRQLHSLTSRVLETKQTGTNFWDCWILIKQKSAKFGPKKNTKTSETQKVCFSLFHFRNEPFFLATVTQFDKSCFGNETNWNKLLGLLDHDQKKNLSNLVQRKKQKNLKHKSLFQFVSFPK